MTRMTPPQPLPPALYAAFDVFPSAKGAAVHIDRFARRLFERAGGGLLYVLGNAELPAGQHEGTVEILRYRDGPANLLERALGFGCTLDRLLARRGGALRLAQFRDPWSGVPLLQRVGPDCRTIYEVNGLPSIELPFAFPAIGPATIAKLRAAERWCLERADCIVTPSHTIARNLVAMGADPQRLRVIPNGAEVPVDPLPPAPAPWPYLLYFGAVQPWQGLPTLLYAFARLADFRDLRLVICAAVHPRRVKHYQRLAEHLGVATRVHWEFQLDQSALDPWRRHALIAVAPLTECTRNLEQGCAPLKILEAMAAGVPVVASDLPAVHEIMTDGRHGRLVPPDRPAELARALRILLEYPQLRTQMGEEARRAMMDHLSWECALTRLDAVYAGLGLD
ncbi:glycosyltransferase [uncultured Thiodictyon sp.]|uniref:glycosyltransferase family 4 protein n=1 Tax=uncultured Thiodictyon sp. TaxID=1846217 RepID=UPI0025F13F06|nr:glycosyltransferase [uncultured Thiodictyon sp.]